MNEPKDWEHLRVLVQELNMLLPRVGFLRQHMPGEANVCVSNAYLKLREARYWLEDAIDEENIQ
jgi:hypothetical protein